MKAAFNNIFEIFKQRILDSKRDQLFESSLGKHVLTEGKLLIRLIFKFSDQTFGFENRLNLGLQDSQNVFNFGFLDISVFGFLNSSRLELRMNN